MTRKIVTGDYELIDIRRIRNCGAFYRVAIKRVAYAPDRLYAWTGNLSDPKQSWTQASTESRDEFYSRVEREIRREWGGPRQGAGRKPSLNPLSRCDVRLSRTQIEFLKTVDPNLSRAIRTLIDHSR